MRPVNPVQKRQPGIASTDVTNELADAINTELGMIGQADDGVLGLEKPTLISILNTGDPLSVYDAVLLQQPLIIPDSDPATDNSKKFREQILLSTTTVGLGSGGLVGIMYENVDRNSEALCIVAGVAICQVLLQTTQDRRADVIGTSNFLTGTPLGDGPVDIVWAKGWETVYGNATATGLQWCVVRLGSRPSNSFPVRLKQNGGSAGDATTICSYTYDIYMLDNTTKINISGGAILPISSPCRGFPMKVNTPATYGQAFRDSGGDIKVIALDESTARAAC